MNKNPRLKQFQQNKIGISKKDHELDHLFFGLWVQFPSFSKYRHRGNNKNLEVCVDSSALASSMTGFGSERYGVCLYYVSMPGAR